MDILYFMEWTCLVVTIMMFLCGIPPCVTMYKTNSTKNVPYIYFVLNIISCSGMLYYGMLVENLTVAFINGVGGILQIIYILTYLYVAQTKAQPMVMLLAAGLYQAIMYWYLFNIVPQTEFAEMLGFLSSTVVTLIVILPIFEIVNNLRNKNADGMPPIMMMGGLSCGVSWLIYGLLLQDPNIYRPNIPGLIIGMIKMAIIIVYSGNEKEKKVQ